MGFQIWNMVMRGGCGRVRFDRSVCIVSCCMRSLSNGLAQLDVQWRDALWTWPCGLLWSEVSTLPTCMQFAILQPLISQRTLLSKFPMLSDMLPGFHHSLDYQNGSMRVSGSYLTISDKIFISARCEFPQSIWWWPHPDSKPQYVRSWGTWDPEFLDLLYYSSTSALHRIIFTAIGLVQACLAY